MTVEHGESGHGNEPASARVAALVRGAQLALAEAEQLLAEVQQATTTLTALDLAARQAAIVDAAHEEAALILAKAHADAARLLERAVSGERVGTSGTPPAVEQASGVVDLRGDDSLRASEDSDPSMGGPAQSSAVERPPLHSPPVQNAPGSTPVVRDRVDPDVRASIAAAADMARRVSGRIERLSQDLHQAPAS